MYLRHVTDADVFAVYRWKMDPESRRWFSVRRTAISWDEHIEWFGDHVVMEHYYIGEVSTQQARNTEYGPIMPPAYVSTPIGAVRIEQDSSGYSWVSIVLAPEHRGKGYGTAMLKALPPIGAPIWALIHNMNAPSLRAFEKAGFTHVRHDGPWRVYRRD